MYGQCGDADCCSCVGIGKTPVPPSKVCFSSSGDFLGRYLLSIACPFVTAGWCVLGAGGVVLASSYLLAQQGCYGDPLRHSDNFLK